MLFRSIHQLDALHEAVILVRDLVFPGAETAAREDAMTLQLLLDHAEGGVAVDARGGVAVSLDAVPAADRKSVVSGKSRSGRVDTGGRRFINKKKHTYSNGRFNTS